MTNWAKSDQVCQLVNPQDGVECSISTQYILYAIQYTRCIRVLLVSIQTLLSSSAEYATEVSLALVLVLFAWLAVVILYIQSGSKNVLHGRRNGTQGLWRYRQRGAAKTTNSTSCHDLGKPVMGRVSPRTGQYIIVCSIPACSS